MVRLGLLLMVIEMTDLVKGRENYIGTVIWREY